VVTLFTLEKKVPLYSKRSCCVTKPRISSIAHTHDAMLLKNVVLPSDLRPKTIRQFIIMRVSSSPQLEGWTQLCIPGVLHSMAIPIYRSTSSLGFFDECNYICAGVDALIDDTDHRVKFIKSVSSSISYFSTV